MDERAKSATSATGAWVTDHDGDKVLLGLTVSETTFLFEYSKLPEEQHSKAETFLFFQLKRRHASALMFRALQRQAASQLQAVERRQDSEETGDIHRIHRG